MKFNGKIIAILPEKSGQKRDGGTWRQVEFVVEGIEEGGNAQYPKKLCVSAYDDKIGTLSYHRVGSNVTVGINVESKEYNGRWFTNARMFSLFDENQEQPQDHASQPYSQPNTQQPGQTQTSTSSLQNKEDDDLIF